MQLFQDERCVHDNGLIQVQTNLSYYEPNSDVLGAVYLEIHEPISGVLGLHLEVRGNLKCAFLRSWYVFEGEGEKRDFVEHTERKKHEYKFLNYNDWLCELPETLEPGSYQVKFKFRLPDDVPSSIYYKGKAPLNLKAKVKYYIKARLKCDDFEDDMAFKQVMIVRERPE